MSGRAALPNGIRLLAELLGFAALLFVTRFVLRGHLAVQMDQECQIGGIALEVLQHGIRFPLVAYAPNEYDNGSFFSGLLTAASFTLFGRNVLAHKLVTHTIAAAGAVAALWLLRACLDELGLTRRRQRRAAIAVLVIALALAPRVVTLFSLYAVGNHAEGSALGMILLALYVYRPLTGAAWRRGAYWLLVGLGVYLNKGVLLVVPALALAELVRLRWQPRPLAAAAAGFLLGVLPELRVLLLQWRSGWGLISWMTFVNKPRRNAQAFPEAFLATLGFLGEYRPALLALWAAALVTGGALFLAAARRARRGAGAAPAMPAAAPVAIGLVLAVALSHLAALSITAKNGLDAYVIYGYPPLSILVALLVAAGCARVTAARGARAGAWAGAAAVVLALVLYRPHAVHWDGAAVTTLRQDTQAACAWRFAEGFRREHEYGLVPADIPYEQHVIARCRSLGEPDLVLDCIGGIARELLWRQADVSVADGLPAGLSADERRAYAWQSGTHRKGRAAPCAEFGDAELTGLCAGAVALECLQYADLYTRITAGEYLGRPRCALTEPPHDGFWAARRREFLSRPEGTAPVLTMAHGDDDLSPCASVFAACY